MSGNREEQIRQRAYALWEKDGGNHGRHDDHWAQAVREIETEIASAAKRVVGAVKTRLAAIGTKAPAPKKAPAAKKPPVAAKASAAAKAPVAAKAVAAKTAAKPAKAVAKASKPVAPKAKAG